MNRRLELTLWKVIPEISRVGGGRFMLDCYNIVLKKDISCTITTKVSSASDKFILEVYDD